jgi:hypothetical protein
MEHGLSLIIAQRQNNPKKPVKLNKNPPPNGGGEFIKLTYNPNGSAKFKSNLAL